MRATRIGFDRDTGREQSITVTMFGGVTDEEVERMIEERKDYEVAEKDAQALRDLEYGVQSIINDLEQRLVREGSNLSASDRASLKGDIGLAKKALSRKDRAELGKMKRRLQSAADALQGLG